MKILFLGSSRFSVIVLEEMLKNGLNVSSVITQEDKPSGRGHKLMPTEVKRFATEKNIDVYCFDRVSRHIEEIKNIDYDIAVVASFGQILPENFLQYKLCINVHPSLLPKYRGASPIQTAILNGDKISGVTIMKVAKEVDAGDIISQSKLNIDGLYYSEAEEALGKLGGQMILKVIEAFGNGTLVFTPQNNEEAVFVRKFEKEDGILDFKLSALELLAKIRALSETTGTFFYIEDKMVKVEKATLSSEILLPRQISQNKKAFIVGCGQGSIEIEQCKMQAGKSMSGRDFLNGHQNLRGGRIDDAR